MRNNKVFTLARLLVVLFVLFTMLGGVFSCGYKYIFSKNIVAKVSEINNIQPFAMNIGTGVIFSSAIMLQTKGGEMFSSSSEDRQWFVVKKDQCVEARLFPYVPWNLEKSGTYYGARLLKIVPCW